MIRILLIALCSLCNVAGAFAGDRMVYGLQDGKLTPYLVEKEFGETRVYNLKTGNVGISEKDFMGDTWNITTGKRPDSGMDILLHIASDD